MFVNQPKDKRCSDSIDLNTFCVMIFVCYEDQQAFLKAPSIQSAHDLL